MFSYINSVIFYDIFIWLIGCLSMSLSGHIGHVSLDVSLHLLIMFSCQQINREIFLKDLELLWQVHLFQTIWDLDKSTRSF